MKQRDQSVAPQETPAMWLDADDLKWAARHWATHIGVKTSIIQIRAMAKKVGIYVYCQTFDPQYRAIELA